MFSRRGVLSASGVFLSTAFTLICEKALAFGPFNYFHGFGFGGDVLLEGNIMPPAIATAQPDIYVNLRTNQYQLKNGTKGVATSKVSVVRATAAAQVDTGGNWSQFGNNILARSNLGASIWEARTNSIRNNTMVGAIVMADGVELLTNGAFASSGAGWTVGTAGGGSVVFSTGSVSITGDGSTNGNYISQQISGLVVGRSYVISVTGTLNSVNAFVGTSAGGTTTLASTILQYNGAGNANPDRIAFTATQTSHWVSIGRIIGSAATITSVSVQDGERCQNGGFTSSPINAAQSTVQNGWQWTLNAGTGTVTYVGGNSVQILGDGTHSTGIDAAIPTVSGFTYTITADITVAAAAVVASTTAFGGGSVLLNVVSGTTTGQKFQFTATGTTTHLYINRTSAATATIANVSVQSAGAMPTNWVFSGSIGGITTSIIGTGTDSGINYIDIQWNGSATGNHTLFFDAAITAAASTVWSNSFFLSIQSGSLTNITLTNVANFTGGGTNLSSSVIPATGKLGLQRFSGGCLGAAGTTAIQPGLNFAASGAVNVTLRIGWPQCELNSGATAANQSSASNPILTTSAAVTRAAEADTLVLTGLPGFGAAYSAWMRMTPQIPAAFTGNQNVIQLDDGTNTQRTLVRRTASAGQALFAGVGGGGWSATKAVTFAQNVSTKWAFAEAANDQQAYYDASAGTAQTAATLPNTPTAVHLGVNASNNEQLNGNIEEIAIWFTQRLPNTTLQAITT